MFKLIAPLVAVGLLAGCAGTKETGGTLLGAASGGLLGSQVGSGRGKLVGTAVGTFAGALLGREVGKSLDNADRAAAQLDGRRDAGWRNLQ